MFRAIKSLFVGNGMCHALDYTCHILVILAACMLGNHFAEKSILQALLLPILMNTIYIGHYLDEKQRAQFLPMIEFCSQFFKSIALPRFTFFTAAITSYFTTTNLAITLTALAISYARCELVQIGHAVTGSPKAFAVLRWFEDIRIASDLQLVFSCAACLLRGFSAYARWRDHDDARLKAELEKLLGDAAANHQLTEIEHGEAKLAQTLRTRALVLQRLHPRVSSVLRLTTALSEGQIPTEWVEIAHHFSQAAHDLTRLDPPSAELALTSAQLACLRARRNLRTAQEELQAKLAIVRGALQTSRPTSAATGDD
ncbi:hypothetical protein BCR37DRAFT_289656 [Protomyces lactucae-debilis]|uniref:Uncharacterized protein n=1 Tax=Protomyces lactucae-debilis TaxID=2754530 RepID=A0A1Y2FIX4_PROLT|nr:uncharacterized protein BCR37DRAFT_289656 [Protomyces lactucae-debilis]ORY83911.1 hypothetical protein BCR37DRAFT_289656 [Protomyces lactucae-debilis]